MNNAVIYDKVNYVKRNSSLVVQKKKTVLDFITRRVILAQTSTDADPVTQGATDNLIESKEMNEKIKRILGFEDSDKYKYEDLHYFSDPDG